MKFIGNTQKVPSKPINGRKLETRQHKTKQEEHLDNQTKNIINRAAWIR